jgi:hypothetical protein
MSDLSGAAYKKLIRLLALELEAQAMRRCGKSLQHVVRRMKAACVHLSLNPVTDNLLRVVAPLPKKLTRGILFLKAFSMIYEKFAIASASNGG